MTNIDSSVNKLNMAQMQQQQWMTYDIHFYGQFILEKTKQGRELVVPALHFGMSTETAQMMYGQSILRVPPYLSKRTNDTIYMHCLTASRGAIEWSSAQGNKPLEDISNGRFTGDLYLKAAEIFNNRIRKDSSLKVFDITICEKVRTPISSYMEAIFRGNSIDGSIERYGDPSKEETVGFKTKKLLTFLPIFKDLECTELTTHSPQIVSNKTDKEVDEEKLLVEYLQDYLMDENTDNDEFKKELEKNLPDEPIKALEDLTDSTIKYQIQQINKVENYFVFIFPFNINTTAKAVREVLRKSSGLLDSGEKKTKSGIVLV